MLTEVKGKQLDIIPNSRPYLLKRLISDGFDVMSLFLLFLALTFVISSTGLASEANQHLERCKQIQQQVISQCGGDSQKAKAILKDNQEYRDELLAYQLHSFLLRMLACGIAEGILLLIIPLCTKDRATLGRLLTGIVLFNESRQTKASRLQVVYRFVFILICASIFPYPWTGIYTFLLIPVIRLTVMMLNKKNKTICDYVTNTMYIEKLSYVSVN